MFCIYSGLGYNAIREIASKLDAASSESMGNQNSNLNSRHQKNTEPISEKLTKSKDEIIKQIKEKQGNSLKKLEKIKTRGRGLPSNQTK